MYVFPYFSKIKAELVKNDAKYLFMCYFTFQAQKITSSREFYLMFQFSLGKMQDDDQIC